MAAGWDLRYPRSMGELQAWFTSDADCLDYLAKRRLLGTHQGSVEEAHLQAYLDEFVFRFNRRTSGSRGLVFLRVLNWRSTTSPSATAN